MPVTEFAELDPEAFHLVGEGATGFPVLVAKAAEGLVDAEKAEMDAKERHALDDSDFAFPKQRKEPINDASHVRNAISRFDQVQGVSAEEKKEAARRILARAKHFGIDVSEDSNVVQAAKQIAPERSVPRSEADSQTDEVSEDVGAGSPPEPDDGGEPRHQVMGSERPPGGSGDGQGDTAPDKDLHRGEAASQTPGAQKADVDMTGDDMASPGGSEEAEADEAEGQTREMEKTDANTPGSAAWEHRDVELGERAEDLVAQLGEVVRTFTEREKAEGGASKQLRRAARTARSLLGNTELLRKVASEMTDTSELIKVLGEYDTARRAEKKAAEKAKAKKAAKAERKAAKAAEKAAKAAGADAVSPKLAKAMGQLEKLQKQVETMAAEDGKRVVQNASGLTALLRGPEGGSIFKELEDRYEVAKAAHEQNPTRTTEARLTQAGHQLTAAKMIRNEHVRRQNPGLQGTQFGPNSTALFSNRNALPDDTGISYAR